ncbi:bacteriocin immunity protein [Pseudomonas sp.]|uniref:bacteriocin immunity protein n=1 Tax=Pseudomonas sp. TaxID=306 RepID=UPI002620B580|nr:bacteriocin immunity protein [Pseudomonas sp.]
MKNKITDYTEKEFLDFLISLCDSSLRTEDDDIKMVLEFERLTEHPEGSDLIYYAASDQEATPEAILAKIKQWRAANGKPGFKEP